MNDARPPYVQFERIAKESKRLTREKGHSVSVDIDYAVVTPQGSRDCIYLKIDTFFENKAKEVRAARIPPQWLDHWKAAYQAWRDGQEVPLNGTPIKTWSVLSPSQVKNLIAANVLTVEDLAAINETGLRKVGMGGQALKKLAKDWLEQASDGKTVLKLQEAENKITALERTVSDLTRKIALLSQDLNKEVEEETPDEFEYGELEDVEAIDPQEHHRPNYKDATRDQLIGAHIREFGRKPHPNASDETIRTKLTSLR